MRFRYINIGIWPDNGWRLQWAIDDITPSEEILIERASGPEGPWTELDVLEHNTVAYEDVIPAFRGFHTLLFYRITVRADGGGAIEIQSDPITTSKAGTHITAEIIRQHEITLKGVNTHPGFGAWDFACFKRTKFGTVCEYCRDPLTGELGLVARCEQCKGTGYIEGWANPIKFRGRWLSPKNKGQMIQATGQSEENIRQLWTAAHPILEPGDILIPKTMGEAWRVKNIQSSEPNGVVTSQSTTVSQIDRQKIEATLTYPGE